MDDQDTLFTSPAKREPWNKGKFTGPGLFRKTEMSDVGQEQTCRLQFPMSALPPKAAAAFADRRGS